MFDDSILPTMRMVGHSVCEPVDTKDTMTEHMFSQHPYRCRFDWGPEGARRAADRGDIVVIVDTLSFSTTVATAVSRGGIIYPCKESADAENIAERVDAEVAVRRDAMTSKNFYSLSPATFANLKTGTMVVLPSLNGATCTEYAAEAPHVFAGTLVNAEEVGRAINSLLRNSQINACVIACGEREKETGHLRVAIEDELGAGAILSRLEFDRSPEAKVCESTFLHNRDCLQDLMWDCMSGRELRACGYEEDVRVASKLNSLDVAPVLRDGAYRSPT
ncbi:MAG: 2-phosphosulfolactate phosphatase [bacterium]|nr:2-phosphosulfolactate phosphatase [bacterium]